MAAHLCMLHSEWMARNPATTPQGRDEMFERFEQIGQVMHHDWSSVPGRAYGFMIPLNTTVSQTLKLSSISYVFTMLQRF